MGFNARTRLEGAGAHGKDDSKVTFAVCEEKDEDGGAARGREMMPCCGRGDVGAQTGYGGLWGSS